MLPEDRRWNPGGACRPNGPVTTVRPWKSCNESSEEDRRHHRRVAVRLAATYRSPTLTIDTQVANLSLGGAFLYSTRVDEIGAYAELSLDVHSRALTIVARVAWTTPRGMGLTFETVDVDQRRLLANLLLQSNTPQP